MKLFLVSLAALIIPSAHASPSLEDLKVLGENRFLSVPHHGILRTAAPQKAGASQESSEEPFLQNPQPQPLPPSQQLGAVVGRAKLAQQLDRHRDLLTRQLGRSVWDIGVAGDAAFKTYYATFRQGSRLVLAPLGDLNRLRGDGIDVTIEPGVVYNLHVTINIFNPVRGSTLEITPARGTVGPEHEVKTGVLLDSIKAHSFVFSSQGVEYWMLYGTDVDPKTNQLAGTRSLLFMNEAGMNSKAWPLAEDSLKVGEPTAVSFGDKRLVLTRSAEGELLIQQP